MRVYITKTSADYSHGSTLVLGPERIVGRLSGCRDKHTTGHGGTSQAAVSRITSKPQRPYTIIYRQQQILACRELLEMTSGSDRFPHAQSLESNQDYAVYADTHTNFRSVVFTTRRGLLPADVRRLTILCVTPRPPLDAIYKHK